MALIYDYIIVFSIMCMICSVSVISSKDCISIEQPNDGYLYNSTTLNCKLGSRVSGEKTFYLTWFIKVQPAVNFTQVVFMYKDEGETTVILNKDYEWKFNTFWEEQSETLSLVLKNTTLEDDQLKTQWKCDISADVCPHDTELHGLEVKGK